MAGALIEKTKSLCPECLMILDAEIFEKNGKVFIRKKCPKHGYFEDLYWGSYEMYEKAKKFARDGRGVCNPNTKGTACPMNCGLCKEHKSHTALANIMVTNRCNLRCWYCFAYAKKEGYVYEPSLEQIRKMVRNLRRERPIPGNAIQLTGGEPCLREDIIDIIKMVKKEGVDHIQLNTNGIRLAQDPDFAVKVREAGVNTIYLSFDGVTEKTNPKNHWEVERVLDNCRKAGIGIVLVPTVIKGVNDHEIGEIIRFAFENIDVIRGINYQPVSLVGLMPRKDRERHRITIPDTISKIEEQTKGQIRKGDFYPIPCILPMSYFVEAISGRKYELSPHFACGMATYVFKENGRILPITRFVDVEGFLNYLDEKAEEIKKGKSKYWVGAKLLYKIGSFIDKEKQPKGFSLAKIIYNALVKHDYKALGDFHRKSLFIGMMHFQDLYNYDIERVKRCCIHYLTPDPKRPIVPFCAFNVIPKWYRDDIQKRFSISIKEWERRTGKKLNDDFYRRTRAK